ncbi:MAG: ATP-grasp domain-containing protein [Alphaproteobacteria bacterium]|nr:ATP-grasp domain-containing protein [Alphaproteobacteria bacterium]
MSPLPRSAAARVLPRNATVAVTGLNATDNPGPGVGVIRALRHGAPFPTDDDRLAPFAGRIVGLAYDALEPGIYARDLVDDVFLVPYPSQGVDALRARLLEIHAATPLDAIIPTLDAELPAFIELAPELQARGIHTFLPGKEQLELRSKVRLSDLGRDHDLPVPESRSVSTVEELQRLEQDGMSFPVWVKGAFYGAERARDVHEAAGAFHRVVARWGLPVIVQEEVPGEEYDVVAVGDGRGGLVGAVPMKKTLLTDKGKGWAGVVVRDPALIALAERFMAATRWRGPCEVECVRDKDGTYRLLEINPRFPAWCFVSAGAGQNLPAAVLRLAMGEPVAPLRELVAGTMFVRISFDQLAHISDLQELAGLGELHRSPEEDR